MTGAEGLLLVGLAFGFALSMGAHYTGACMGMAYAAGALSRRAALLAMAPLALAGAVLASGPVQATVGGGLLPSGSVGIPVAIAILAAAFGLTSAYNLARMPTSTIQILVFAVVGAGLAAGLPVVGGTVLRLVVVWVVAPPAAAAVGFLLLRLVDRGAPRLARSARAVGPLAFGLALAGAAASFALGANDVANAAGPLVLAGFAGPLLAGAIGGSGLAAGVLSWGRPLLTRMAKEIVTLDPAMAVAAQAGQAAVILTSVAFGYFTSMNQALVGAIAGVGYARSRATVRSGTVRAILVGWAIGPASGAAAGYGLVALLRAAGLA